MVKQSIFTVGGTVQAGGGIYLHRKVDDELLAICREGTFGYVLTARQMGKSSLMVQTAQRLATEGIRTVVIDLNQIGVQVTAEAWYLGLLTTIEDSLDLETDVHVWWAEHTHLGFAQRMTRYIQEIALEEVTDRVVIFIDEIDATLSLPFTDDFYAAIRYIYNARSNVPVFERLSFVLIGVATPDDLISDPKRTPFNIGRGVSVDYFKEEEAMPLANGFDLPPGEARQVMHWIMHWTGGHPYLTQRLCRVIAEQQQGEVTKADVEEAVALAFIKEKRIQDSNLRFVQDMLTRRVSDPIPVLTVYRRIWKGHRIVDSNQSSAITHLKLSGLVRRTNGRLGVSNLIYAEVFNRTWIKEQWPEHWIKRVPPAAIGLVVALFVVVILLTVMYFQTQMTSRATVTARQAQENSARLDSLNTQLRFQYTVAESLGQVAIGQKNISDSLRRTEEEVNVQLTEQVRISDTLLARLSEENWVSDSLRRLTQAANDELIGETQLSDSLRGVAEVQLGEAQEARLETITIALASKAARQVRLGEPVLGALLARQAYAFSLLGDGAFIGPVYDALVRSLNAVGSTPVERPGGPEILSGFDGGIRAVAFSPDGSWMAAAIEDGTVALVHKINDLSRVEYIEGFDASARCVAFSPDGSYLAAGGDDSRLIVWKVLGQERPDLYFTGNHEGGVWTVTFAPGEDRMASAGADGQIKIWDLEAGDRLQTLEIGDGVRIRSIVFNPDGTVLVSGSDDGMLRMWRWEEESNRPLNWDSHQGRLHTLAFHPDGSLLASGGDSLIVRLWNMRQPDDRPQEYTLLRGHEGPVHALVFSSDGKQLASGSADQRVQLWQTDHFDFDPIVLQGHSLWVWGLAFSPHGRTLVSGAADRSMFIWNTQPGQLAEQVCRVAGGRDLSPDEWIQHVGGDFLYSEYFEPCE